MLFMVTERVFAFITGTRVKSPLLLNVDIIVNGPVPSRLEVNAMVLRLFPVYSPSISETYTAYVVAMLMRAMLIISMLL